MPENVFADRNLADHIDQAGLAIGVPMLFVRLGAIVVLILAVPYLILVSGTVAWVAALGQPDPPLWWALLLVPGWIVGIAVPRWLVRVYRRGRDARLAGR